MNTINTYQVDTIQPVTLSSTEEMIQPVKNSQEQQNLDVLIDSFQEDTIYGFENHQLIPVRSVEVKNKTIQKVEHRFTPEQRKIEVTSWQTILLVFCFFLLALIKAFNRTRFKESYKALFNYSVAQEIIREEKVLFHRVNMALTLIYILTTGLVILLVRDMFELPNYNKPLLYASIVGTLILIYVIKFLTVKILFFIYDGYPLANEYIFNVSIYNSLLGVVFIPVLSVAFFTSVDITSLLYYMILPLLLIVLLARVFRLTIIGNANGILYLYIFLYICTLEILPLVVLYGIFIHS